MARLGQLLVRGNLVSENNLARALGVQHFAGGRLGTLLLERGSVNEDDLGNTLAQQHGCEYAPWRVLGEVSPGIIAALPAKFAIKHSAVPYERGEGYLKVALRDPGDLRILDELFFVTGRKIVPGVAPEVRLYQALEKYYGERRTPRFAILAEKLSRPVRGVRTAPVAPPPSAFFPEVPHKPTALPGPTEVWGEPSDADLAAPPLIQDWKIPDQRAGGWAGISSPSAKPPATADPETISWEETPPLWMSPEEIAARESASAPPAEAVGREGILPPASEAPPAAAPAAAAAEDARPVAPAVGSAGSPRPLPSIPDFAELSKATDRDAIASTVLGALSRRFARSALFTVRPGGVFGWAAAGNGVDVEAVRRIEIPWTEPSLFLNVRLSRAFYLGPLPPLPRHAAIARAFGGSADECLVQPILIKEKPVAFLYVEFPRDRGATPIDLAYLRELSAAAAKAFVSVIRQKKREI